MPWPPPLSARWTALALFLFALGLHLFVALGGALVGLDFKVMIVVDELAAILAAPLLVTLLLRLPIAQAFLLRSAHWSHYLIAVAAAVPLQLFGGSLQEVVLEIMPGGDQWREMVDHSLDSLARTDGVADLLLLLLGGVVLAAACEEILFRGVLLQLLARGDRWRSAILVTGLLFALFHLDPVGLVPRTLMGVYFGVLVWRSGSIFPAMLAHGANNLMAFAALPLVEAAPARPALVETVALGTAGAVAFALLVVLWWRLAPLRSSDAEQPVVA